ncbi:MAG: hypothetical protein IVW36_11245 [Dehalococcoidia bacterium]|nr:hypothetical protein [Dehalococcoidia bacterium]
MTGSGERPGRRDGPEAKAAARRKGLEFYAGITADAGALMEADAIEGIDAEVALLRAQLRERLRDDAQDFDVLLKGVRLLMQAVTARYRMSPARSAELADSITSILQQVGGQFFPERAAEV